MKKMTKRFFSLFLVTVLMITALCQVAFAEETAGDIYKTEFVITEPDADGYAIASLVVYDSKFSGLQFGFSFDNTVLEFVDKETKSPSDSFERVATLNDFETEQGTHTFETIGCQVSNSEGILKMAVYGFQSVISDENAAITVGSDGFSVFDFCVRFLKTENPNFQVLDTNSIIYPKDAFVGDGISDKPTSLKFTMPESFGVQNEVTVYEPVLPEPTLKTLRKERVVDSLILNIGNFAAVDDGYLKVIDEGNREVVPFIEADRTYLPLRFIGEAFGAEVNWNPDNQEIKVTLGEIVVVMNIGKTTYTVDGEAKEMDVAPFIKEDRTFIPVRYIGEALNKAVYWDGALKLVIVTAEDKPWDPDGKAEKNILPDALLLMSEMVRDMMLSDIK